MRPPESFLWSVGMTASTLAVLLTSPYLLQCEFVLQNLLLMPDTARLIGPTALKMFAWAGICLERKAAWNESKYFQVHGPVSPGTVL